MTGGLDDPEGPTYDTLSTPSLYRVTTTRLAIGTTSSRNGLLVERGTGVRLGGFEYTLTCKWG